MIQFSMKKALIQIDILFDKGLPKERNGELLYCPEPASSGATSC